MLHDTPEPRMITSSSVVARSVSAEISHSDESGLRNGLSNEEKMLPGKPGTPADAWHCFMGTNMDVLAVGRFVLEKADQPAHLADAADKQLVA